MSSHGTNNTQQTYYVAYTPDNLGNYDNRDITQGWLHVGSEGTEELVEREGISTYRHIQRFAGHSVVSNLTREQFDAIWPLADVARIEKTRHFIPHQGAVIHLDAYDGERAGYMTAEVVFADVEAAAQFEAPEWLLPRVGAVQA